MDAIIRNTWRRNDRGIFSPWRVLAHDPLQNSMQRLRILQQCNRQNRQMKSRQTMHQNPVIFLGPFLEGLWRVGGA